MTTTLLKTNVIQYLLILIIYLVLILGSVESFKTGIYSSVSVTLKVYKVVSNKYYTGVPQAFTQCDYTM